MDKQKYQEINDNLAELSEIVNLYNPKEGIWFCVALLSFQAICIIVILWFADFWGTFGTLVGILLLGLFIVPIIYYMFEECSPKKHSPSNVELAERACIIMSACVNRYKYPDEEIYFLQHSIYESNLSLYKEFISIFPQMESKKLKKLSTIKLRG